MEKLESEEGHRKKSIYDFHVTTMDGDDIILKDFEGQVLLIVNTASKCRFAEQFKELEELYEAYKDQGFTILAFPCNQFMGQEPYEDEVIRTYCTLTFGISFPIFSKIDVKGKKAHPLFRYLKRKKTGIFGREIKWIFTKFLVDRRGRVRERYAPMVPMEKIKKDIEKTIKV